MSTMTSDLRSIGMNFDQWQDAVEAAIASNALSVTGEVRGGQLVQFADPSGAQLNILAVEPFATFAGFASQTQTFAHISMVNDVVALCELVDYNGQTITTVTVNLAQGPLLVDEPEQRWQQLGLSALATEVEYFADAAAYQAQYGDTAVGALESLGAEVVASGTGLQVPDATATCSARVLEASYRTNGLTGDKFIHAMVDSAVPFDVCLPYRDELPERDSIIRFKAVLVGSVIAPAGGCGGGGCGSGGCGCGGH